MKRAKSFQFSSAMLLLLVLLGSQINIAGSSAEQTIKPFEMKAGDFDETVTIDGNTRSFIVHVPPQFNSGKQLPVVLLFHGGSGTARGMMRLTKFNQVADSENVLAVYPEGIQRSWNDGRSVKERKGTDDVGFISAAIDFLVKRYRADPHSVYVTGISNGGFFSERLALQIPHKIAAVAIVDAGLTNELSQLETLNKPVPTLLLLGTKDPLVPFEGGNVGGKFSNRGTVLPASETIKFWTARNHCFPKGQSRELRVIDQQDPTRIIETCYLPKADGKITVVCTVVGGGHTWPSGIQYMPKAMIGRTTKQFSNDDIWKFFADKHSD